MQKNHEEHIESMLTAREQRDLKIKRANEDREYQMMVKKEMEMINRENKLENVARIGRANEYEHYKVMQKIQADKDKADEIARQRQQLLGLRANVRQQADRDRKDLNDTFESMRKKGNFDMS